MKPPQYPDPLKAFQVAQGYIVVATLKQFDDPTPLGLIGLRRELILLLLRGPKKSYGLYGETFNLRAQSENPNV